MAYCTLSLSSQVMSRSVEISLYLPSDLPPSETWEIQGVMTLLHGYTGSGKDWTHYTAAPRYAADNGLVLICPSCGNCFYHDMVYGEAWKTFVTEEMPELLSRMFRLPREREKNWIAGLSMGGYGAFYLGLSRPDLYAGCASFSGAVDLRRMVRHAREYGMETTLHSVLGAQGVVPESSDLFYLLEQTAALPPDRQPLLLQTAGTEDVPIYNILLQNRELYQHAQKLGLASYAYLEWPGVHEWNFWDRSLVYALDAFLHNGYAARKLADWRCEAVTV